MLEPRVCRANMEYRLCCRIALPPTTEKSDMNIVHVSHLSVMQRIRFKDWELNLEKGRS